MIDLGRELDSHRSARGGHPLEPGAGIAGHVEARGGTDYAVIRRVHARGRRVIERQNCDYSARSGGPDSSESTQHIAHPHADVITFGSEQMGRIIAVVRKRYESLQLGLRNINIDQCDFALKRAGGHRFRLYIDKRGGDAFRGQLAGIRNIARSRNRAGLRTGDDIDSPTGGRPSLKRRGFGADLLNSDTFHAVVQCVNVLLLRTRSGRAQAAIVELCVPIAHLAEVEKLTLIHFLRGVTCQNCARPAVISGRCPGTRKWRESAQRGRRTSKLKQAASRQAGRTPR